MQLVYASLPIVDLSISQAMSLNALCVLCRCFMTNGSVWRDKLVRDRMRAKKKTLVRVFLFMRFARSSIRRLFRWSWLEFASSIYLDTRRNRTCEPCPLPELE